MWNKDEVKGKGKQVKGTIKEKIGQATSDPNLQDEGRAERTEGDVEETVGKVRRKAGEAVEKVGKAISRG